MIKLLRLSLLVLLSLLLVSGYGYCSETSEQTETIKISRQDWNKLQSNNNKLLNNLNLLEQELNQAKEQLRISKLGLTEAQSELIQSKQEIAELKKELAIQKQRSQELNRQLEDLKNSSQIAEDSLKKANESLQSIIIDVREEFEEHKRVERKLRTQKIIWQIVAIGAAAWAASK